MHHVTISTEVFWFGLKLNVQVNSYGHAGTVSSPRHIFFLGKLDKAVYQYFVHILSLVTDNNHSWIRGMDSSGIDTGFTQA